MQDLGFDMKDVSAMLMRNITNSSDSAKDLSDQSAEYKKLVQLVLETNILCVMEAVENFLMDHDWDGFLLFQKPSSVWGRISSKIIGLLGYSSKGFGKLAPFT